MWTQDWSPNKEKSVYLALSTILPDFSILNCTWILDTENEDLQTIVLFNYGCVIFPWLLTLSPSNIFRSMLKNSQSQSQHHELTVACNKQATRIFTLTSSRSSPRCLKRGARRKSPQVGVVGRQEWTLWKWPHTVILLEEIKPVWSDIVKFISKRHFVFYMNFD